MEFISYYNLCLSRIDFATNVDQTDRSITNTLVLGRFCPYFTGEAIEVKFFFALSLRSRVRRGIPTSRSCSQTTSLYLHYLHVLRF